MKLLYIYIISLILIFFTACVEYKEYPFPYDKNSTLDLRLSGTWKIDIKKTDFKKLFNEDKPQSTNEEIITFIPNKENNLYSIKMGNSTTYAAYTSILKKHKYLNFMPGTNFNTHNHYKYTIINDELVIYMQNPKVLIEDIKNKKIWGSISKNGLLPIVKIHIAQEPKLYKKYLLENDKRLYNLPLYFTRVKEKLSTQIPTSSK